jgi:hypothetical protein
MDTELSNIVTTTKNSKIYHKKKAQSNKIMRASQQQQMIFSHFKNKNRKESKKLKIARHLSLLLHLLKKKIFKVS